MVPQSKAAVERAKDKMQPNWQPKPKPPAHSVAGEETKFCEAGTVRAMSKSAPAAKLLIRKRMQLIQGKVRPCCYVQAFVDAGTQGALEEHFLTDQLFKRSAYAQSWPQGAIDIPAALAPALSTFLKNDACPEITVKTLLTGQLHQGANVWEMMAFELIAKLSFDNFLALCVTVGDLKRDIYFEGSDAPAHFDFASDDAVARLERAAAEMAA